MHAYPRCLLLLLAALLTAGTAWAQGQEEGWLGVELRDLTREDAQALGWQAPRGAKVDRPVQDSPAATAGLERGDVIATLDGNEVGSAEALTTALNSKAAGVSVQLRLIRAGTERAVTVTLSSRPEVSYSTIRPQTSSVRASTTRPCRSPSGRWPSPSSSLVRSMSTWVRRC
jgi:C-terminal processing protease CtpA/Prc